MTQTKLVICEKPNVARKIADALSKLGKVEEKRYKKISYYVVSSKNTEIVIAPSVGHLFGLKSDQKNLTYPVFGVYWAPANEIDNISYIRDYIDMFEYLGKKADECISACDYDVEGSLIGYNIIRFCCKKNTGKRMKFSTLTAEDLLESYQNMLDLDISNAVAGETRHVLDWYYGINLSRALMSALKKAKSWHKIFSIGRVQGPALDLIVSLEEKIRSFVPQPYWTISIVLKSTEFNYEKERIKEEKKAQDILNLLKGAHAKIVEAKQQEHSYNPYPSFDLTDLQTEAYRLFGFSPSQTLNFAQSLYEKGVISYPRTSSQKLPASLNLHAIIRRLEKLKEYSVLIKEHVKSAKPIEGKKEDPAHPAIHPTGYTAEMTQQEAKLYDLIVRRFLACFAAPAVRVKKSIKAEVNSLFFTATGWKTTSLGWLNIYHYAKFEEVDIDDFTEGETLKVKEARSQKKTTSPPQRYTQASLISELEKRKLGTKATRATIIDTLYEREYITGKSIAPTPLGIKVHHALKTYAPKILNEQLTRDIEEKLEKIMFGEAKSEEIIEESKNILLEILDDFQRHEVEIGNFLAEGIKELDQVKNTLGECTRCGKGVLRKLISSSGKWFVGCSNYPECKVTYNLPQNSVIVATKRLCEKCNTPIVKVYRKGRKTFEMCLDPNCETKKLWNSPQKKD